MTEREQADRSGTGGEEYGGVNEGAPGDAPVDDATPSTGEEATAEPQGADEGRRGRPNQGATGDAPADKDAAP